MEFAVVAGMVVLCALASFGLWTLWKTRKALWWSLVGYRLRLRKMNSDMRALGHSHGMWVMKRGESAADSWARHNPITQACPVCYPKAGSDDSDGGTKNEQGN